MIYTEMTVRAARIAEQAHHGQTKEDCFLCIPPLYHTGAKMHWFGSLISGSEITTAAALLHDVAEDTAVTIEMLEAEFPPEVTETLRLLTHDPAEDYFDYVRRIRSDPRARAVKLADLRHNMDIRRLPPEAAASERTAARLEKYRRAVRLLTEDLC